MKKYYTIPERPELLRERYSKGLVAVDPKILEAEALRQKQKASRSKMENDINSINERLDRLETLLTKFLNK